MLIDRALGLERDAGAPCRGAAACVLAIAALRLAGEFRARLANQPSQIRKIDEPQLVRRPDRLFGDGEISLPAINLDRRRMIAAAAVFEGAPILAVKKILCGWTAA